MSSLSQVSDTPKQTPPMSGRQRKRWKQKQHVKELKRQNVYDKNRVDQYDDSDYYFENGLRKVYPYHFTFTTCVQESWAGRPILEVFAEQFQSNTKDNYRKSIEAGHLRVNGESVSVDYVLKPKDIIVNRIHRHENPVTDETVEVIFQDKNVLVVNKPASIPCQPCGRYRFNSGAFILCKELGLPMLRNIYRLDWLTSGVMVCAKTKEKAAILEHQIQKGFVTKEYVARVHGEFPLGVVTLNQPIGCVAHRLFLWKVTPTGKPSKTRFERMSYNGTSSVVKCVPLEVRTAHHIRVHLQFLGHPILNDPVYNSEVWGPLRGKSGVYDRPDSEVIKDVVEILTVGRWSNERNPILDMKNISQPSDDAVNDEADATASVAEVDSHLEPCEDSSEMPIVENNHMDTVLGDNLPKSVPDKVNSDKVSTSTVGDVGEVLEETQECTCPCSCGRRKVPKNTLSGESSQKTLKDQGSQTVWSAAVNFSSKINRPSGSSHMALHSESALPTDDTLYEPAVKKFKSLCDDSDLVRKKTNGHEPTLSDCKAQNSENDDIKVSTDKSGSQTESAVSQPPSRLGFDINKWTPDPHCAECDKKYIDPDPKRLMIYLHALRYKGPGWEYSTKLPSWAEEDWQGE